MKSSCAGSGALQLGIGLTRPKKKLKLLELLGNFLVHAIDFGYQRRQLVPAHQHDRSTAKSMPECQQFGQARHEVGGDNCRPHFSRRRHLAQEIAMPGFG